MTHQEMNPPPLPDPARKPTLTVPEAGRILGLSRDAAYQAAARKQIPTLRIGRRLLVPTARLLAMLGIGAAVAVSAATDAETPWPAP